MAAIGFSSMAHQWHNGALTAKENITGEGIADHNGRVDCLVKVIELALPPTYLKVIVL